MVRNLYIPRWVMKAVLSTSLGSNATWWYELLRSKVGNQWEPDIASRQSSVWGGGYASFRVASFSWR